VLDRRQAITLTVTAATTPALPRFGLAQDGSMTRVTAYAFSFRSLKAGDTANAASW
jgi:hypothetical protein